MNPLDFKIQDLQLEFIQMILESILNCPIWTGKWRKCGEDKNHQFKF